MIKHYFCEYCGKDFLSEDECLKHEKNCEVKKNNELKKKAEAEKKADMDKIMSSFADTVRLCKDYMEKYDIFDIDKFGKTLKDKLNEVEEKIFSDFNSEPMTNFRPVELTLDDLKFNLDEFRKVCGETESIPVTSEEVKTNHYFNPKTKDEVDVIIDKLSNPSLVVEHDDKDSEDVTTYYFNGKPVSQNEFIERCMGLMSPKQKEILKKDIGWDDIDDDGEDWEYF